MKYFKKLVGKNIYLSPINIEDVEQYTKWMNDFSVTDYINRSSNITTLEQEKEYLRKVTDEKDLSFAIVRLEDDKLLGNCSIHDVGYLRRVGTLGIFIGDVEDRHKGYGTEALQLLLDYGFNYLNLNNIMLCVMEYNPNAFECYKKIGFKEFGRRRKAQFLNGKYYDIIYLDMLAQEFTESYIQNKNV